MPKENANLSDNMEAEHLPGEGGEESTEVSPIVEPPNEFSEGEEVNVTFEGKEHRVKVLGVEGDKETGFKYKLSVPTIITVDEAELTKL